MIEGRSRRGCLGEFFADAGRRIDSIDRRVWLMLGEFAEVTGQERDELIWFD